MAKIVNDVLAIEISRIAKDDEHLPEIINDEMKVTLEQVVQQLVGEGVVVEVKTYSGE